MCAAVGGYHCSLGCSLSPISHLARGESANAGLARPSCELRDVPSHIYIGPCISENLRQRGCTPTHAGRHTSRSLKDLTCVPFGSISVVIAFSQVPCEPAPPVARRPPPPCPLPHAWISPKFAHLGKWVRSNYVSKLGRHSSASAEDDDPGIYAIFACSCNLHPY